MTRLFSKGRILVLSLLMGLSLVGCSKEVKVETSTKEVLWSYKTNGAILSSPAIYKNDIIFGNNDKSIYSIDLNTKEEKWKLEIDSAINSALAIDGDNVLFSSQSTCYLVDAKTGKLVWKYESKDTGLIDSYDLKSSSPILYKDLVLFQTKNGTLYGLNKVDGRVTWEYKAEGSGEVRTTPSIQNNILCFGDVVGNVYAMDLDTQKTLWSKSIGTQYVHAALAYNDYAYFSGRDCKVVAFDLKSGDEKWSYKDPVGSWLTADMEVRENILYVPGSDNLVVTALKFDSGEKVKTYGAKGNIFGKPFIDGNMMYVTSGNVYTKNLGGITAYDLSAGNEKVWETPLETRVLAAPVAKDGVVYFGAGDGKLYAIKY